MRPLLLAAALLFSMAAPARAVCPAQVLGPGTRFMQTKVSLTGNFPDHIENGITDGLGQWNDCKENPWDWPQLTVAMPGEDQLFVSYHPGVEGPGACASYNGQQDICLWDSYTVLDDQGQEITVDCTHSRAAVSDIIAHEVGHYFGLDESDCECHIMGPVKTDGAGRISSSYEISGPEKSKVDTLNTNEVEEFEEDCGGDQGCGNQGGGSPILIDLSGNLFGLSGLDEPVRFDIDGDRVAEELGWTLPHTDDVFLARDRNGNGSIDSGRELFGDATLDLVTGEAYEHGYAALAQFDAPTLGGNADGFIDARDAYYPELLGWLDADHDGRSDPGELLPLAELGIVRLALRFGESTRADRHGNEFRYYSRAWLRRGQHSVGLWTTDVFFVLSPETRGTSSAAPDSFGERP